MFLGCIVARAQYVELRQGPRLSVQIGVWTDRNVYICVNFIRMKGISLNKNTVVNIRPMRCVSCYSDKNGILSDRSTKGIAELIVQTETPDKLFEYYRIPVSSFGTILSMVKFDVSKKNILLRECVSAEKTLQCAIR